MMQRSAISAWRANGKLLHSCALLSLLLLTGMNSSAGDSSLEYQVKAAFLLNFLKFVEWPQDGAQPVKPGAPLVVGVYGDDPFGDALERTFNGKNVDGRPVVLRHCNTEDEAAGCHLVFVGAGHKFGPLLENLQAKNVLTVGEAGEFLRGGGVIRFVIEDERVRFEISLAAADRARLHISAKLLQLARKVYRKGEPQ